MGADEAPGVIPVRFLCAISGELPLDPVMAADGFIYDRGSLEVYMAKGNTTDKIISPKTGEKMSKEFSPALGVRDMIADMIQEGFVTGNKVTVWKRRVALLEQEAEKISVSHLVQSTREKASTGDSDAMWMLGEWHARGHNGLAQNEEEAFKWYLQAAETGHGGAKTDVGTCYANGKGVAASQSLALFYYAQAATLGDETACQRIDHITRQGSVEGRTKVQKPMSSPASSKAPTSTPTASPTTNGRSGTSKSCDLRDSPTLDFDDLAARFEMMKPLGADAFSKCLRKNLGDGVHGAVSSSPKRRNLIKEFASCDQPARGGAKGVDSFKASVESAFVTNLLCPISRTLPLDPVTAEDGQIYERRAIEECFAKTLESDKVHSPKTGQEIGRNLASAPEIRNLIEDLVRKNVLTGDKVEAWNRKIEKESSDRAERQILQQLVESTTDKARLGDAQSMAVLGEWYARGRNSLQQDHREAFEWFKKAARKGHASAAYEVAQCYTLGHGVARSDAMAVFYYTQAATLGSERGCYAIGTLFDKGSSTLVPHDPEEACSWLSNIVEGDVSYKDGDDVLRRDAHLRLEVHKCPLRPAGAAFGSNSEGNAVLSPSKSLSLRKSPASPLARPLRLLG